MEPAGAVPQPLQLGRPACGGAVTACLVGSPLDESTLLAAVRPERVDLHTGEGAGAAPESAKAMRAGSGAGAAGGSGANDWYGWYSGSFVSVSA